MANNNLVKFDRIERVNDYKIRIHFKTEMNFDKDGYFARQCYNCPTNFKLRPLKERIYCPRCLTFDFIENFNNENQKLFLKSVRENIINKTMWAVMPFQKTVPNIPIYQYNDDILPTEVKCSKCEVEYILENVFAYCPGCGKLNVDDYYNQATKNLLDKFLRGQKGLDDSLKNAVEIFDSMGKQLLKKHPNISKRYKGNLFQNINELNNRLINELKLDIDTIIGESCFDFLIKMFNVRHVYVHNSGVVDDKSIKNAPILASFKDKVYPLNKDELKRFLVLLRNLGLNLCKLLL